MTATEPDRTAADTGRRIVVGIDGSQSSMDALAWAGAQAELTGATLEVVTTWEWPMSYGWAPPYPAEFDPAAASGDLVEGAAKTVERAHPSVRVRTVVTEGHPAPVLVSASRGADLLVVGSRGHGEFAGMLIGSVSEHCATNAHCPVVVMRDATE